MWLLGYLAMLFVEVN